jgi:stage V sporulation protein SpoVS
MEFASYLAGERWSDHPACTHPLLAAMARDVNDLTGNEARSALMPLVTRVIGLNGDDPLLYASLAVRAGAAAIPIASMERQRALAAGLIGVIASVDSPELSAIAEDALATVPDAERWARGYLATSGIPHTFSNRAATAIVHTSVVGIALACVPDGDARLAALLEDAIATTEAILAATRTAEPTKVALQLA